MKETFPVTIGDVTADPIVFQKSNIEIVSNLGDLRLQAAQFVKVDPDNPNYEIWSLEFSRTVEGGPPRLYEAEVSGLSSFINWTGEIQSGFFDAASDVILTIRTLGQSTWVNFCRSGCDLSSLRPDASPYMSILIPLWDAPYHGAPDDLTLVPGVDLDPTGHPVLDQYNTDNDFTDDESFEGATKIIDRRQGAVTTIVARTGDFNPERDGAFDSLSRLNLPPLIDNSGGVVFETQADKFFEDAQLRGYHCGNGSQTQKLVAKEISFRTVLDR